MKCENVKHGHRNFTAPKTMIRHANSTFGLMFSYNSLESGCSSPKINFNFTGKIRNGKFLTTFTSPIIFRNLSFVSKSFVYILFLFLKFWWKQNCSKQSFGEQSFFMWERETHVWKVEIIEGHINWISKWKFPNANLFCSDFPC